jgi:uncharacterized protein (DUF58 family)
MAVTGRAALLALLGLLPVIASPHLTTAFGTAVVLLVLLAVDVLLAATVRRRQVTRSGSTACRLGEPAEVQLSVVNATRRRLRGELRDAWVPSAGAGPRTHRLSIPPGERRVLTTTLHPTRRGDRMPDRITVRALGPLGLAGRQGRHEVPWRVRVQPPFTSRKFLPEKLDKLRQLDGQLLTRTRGQGTEFDSLREYVDGDDVRSIDWRATARKADVVVRTWRPERDRRLLVVLDTGRTSAARIGDVPRLDLALDAALLLGALASRAGDRVDVLAIDREVRATVEGAGREVLLGRMVDAMAVLEPALVETDNRRLVSEVLRRSRRRSLVVLFTALDAAPLREGLLPVLSSLTSRHTVVLASVGDSRLDDLAAGRTDVDAVYAAAAAEKAQADRRALTAELRRKGVEVIDAGPDTFASHVADAYLSLKAAGRL